MDAAAKEELVHKAGELGALYKTGQIGLEIYGRFMVGLAHSLMVGDELQLSVGVCTEIPDKYYEAYMPEQIVEDPDFGQMAGYLSKRFRIHGFLPPDYEVSILSRIGVA